MQRSLARENLLRLTRWSISLSTEFKVTQGAVKTGDGATGGRGW